MNIEFEIIFAKMAMQSHISWRRPIAGEEKSRAHDEPTTCVKGFYIYIKLLFLIYLYI